MSEKSLLFLLSLMYCINGHTEILFSESFESGGLSAGGVINFKWEDFNRTSIVTQTEEGNEVVSPNLNKVHDGRNWEAKDGDNSLRFRYQAGETMTEQRFSFDNQTELWISYWIRVPINFYQGSQNSKFFVIWADDYSGPVFAQWQTRPDGLGQGGAKIGVTDGPSSLNSGEEQKTDFITVPDDRGRWMEVVHYLKTGSGDGVADGVIQLYRRWEGEANFTLIHDMQDAENQWHGAGVGYRQGYFMGWANDPYAEDTEWLIDDIVFSSTGLTTRPLSPQLGPLE